MTWESSKWCFQWVKRSRNARALRESKQCFIGIFMEISWEFHREMGFVIQWDIFVHIPSCVMKHGLLEEKI